MTAFDDAVTAAQAAKVTGDQLTADLAEANAEVARLSAELADCREPAPATSRVMLGVSENAFTDFQTKVGPQASIRIYTATQDITGSYWVKAKQHAANGVLPVVTSKRSDQAFLDRVQAYVQTWAMRPRLDFFHEPEDNIAGGEFSAATYIANFRRFSTTLRSVADIAWCMMTWTWESASGRNPNTYWPGDEYVDIVAVDGYQYNKVPPRFWGSIFDPCAQFARDHGKKFAIYEYGTETKATLSGMTSEMGAQSMRDWRAWATGCDVLDMATYWENLVTGNDYQFRNDPVIVAAYRETMADPLFQRTA